MAFVLLTEALFVTCPTGLRDALKPILFCLACGEAARSPAESRLASSTGLSLPGTALTDFWI